MSFVVLLIVGLVEVAILGGVLFYFNGKGSGNMSSNLVHLKDELEQKRAFKEELTNLYSGMIDLTVLQKLLEELEALEESLKAERGRITITQAELETVETRLRELEEIERELEASGLETKEELNILKKKEADLAKSNEALKAKVAESSQQIEEVMSEIEMNTQMQEQVQRMQTELLNTETKIDTLLLQIEQGNDQYFILKKRYDALDIEYAQLYEKFSSAEESSEE